MSYDSKTNKTYNIDGEEIDLSKDDLMEKVTFETANLIRRLCAFFLDSLLIIGIWYLCTRKIFIDMENFVANLGINENDFLDNLKYQEFVEKLIGLIVKTIIIFIFVQTIYYTLIPAIIGQGRTLGKLAAGIGCVSYKTLEEASPKRLILREFVVRGLIETLFVIPLIISFIIAFIRKDSRSLHDILSGTVVIKLDLYDIE